MTISDMFRTPANVECPHWCTQPAGHPYGTHAATGLNRLHRRRYQGPGLAVDIEASEQAVSAAGPVLLGPVEAVLWTQEAHGVPMTPVRLRAAARTLEQAADALTQLWAVD